MKYAMLVLKNLTRSKRRTIHDHLHRGVTVYLLGAGEPAHRGQRTAGQQRLLGTNRGPQ